MTAEVTSALAALVRGERLPGGTLAAWAPEAFCDAAEYHGVLPIVGDRLFADPDTPAWLDRAVRERLRRHVTIGAIQDLELRAVVGALERSAVAPLLLKGAHVAYAYYPRPDLRPRLDTDILIEERARTAAHDALLQLGYVRDRHVSGSLVMAQATYLKHRDGALVHAADIHWRLANPHLFAGLFSYEELAASAVPVAGLAQARGLSDSHALIVAAVHRVAHHFDSDRLIWLYDLHLIASSMTPAAVERALALADARGVATICRHSLERARETFHTHIVLPPAPLQGTAAAAHDAATAGYLKRQRRPVQNLAADLRALPTWGARLRLIREHLFPPADYMRGTYAPASKAPLTMLYVRRVVRGARKWLVRA